MPPIDASAHRARPPLQGGVGPATAAPPAASEHAPDSGRCADVAVLVLADIAAGSRAWGYARFVVQRMALRGTPGLRLAKVMGSGHGGGFGLKPSLSHQALFCLFDGEAHADAFVASAAVQAYRTRADEFLVAKLRACSARGSWSGATMAVTAPTPTSGPVASLTRASIRPARARAFWRMQPAAEAALADARGCVLSAGVGELPLLRQATFTVWSSTDAMDAYARSGAHLAAIRAAYGQAFFSESMFVRFVPLLLQGRWQGVQHG